MVADWFDKPRPPTSSTDETMSPRRDDIVLAYIRLSERDRSLAVSNMLDKGILMIGPQMRIEVANESR